MNKNNIMIPAAIIIAGALIAGGIYYGGKKSDTGNGTGQNKVATETNVRPVDSTDHVLGNPNAKLVIVEYSDLQCPYCQDFATSLKQLTDTYSKDGSVALVYRHFPLSQIHKYAEKAAEASECVADIGGNDKFWAFIDDIFADGKTQEQKVANITDEAVSVGIDKTAFTSCLSSGKFASKVASNAKEGSALGVTGTPTSFILSKGKIVSQIPGDVPFDQLKLGIDSLLKE